ncbi:MAG: hypothetical protein GAK28_04053 [Luteibacter sp.]|uniref:tetratricopeptide repeat protein n=1 Tax=Luteibacter sp. TaxID=1886636 RepID=UPI0013858E21|nr:tetratricopeptide repeat protein [Luteibacter sp.]KAF1004347.1 MAG: hypothetical protein GAK28_04053 [Luteibacter sp.]
MKKLLLALVLFALAGLATAADSPHDVQALLARGDYPGAEALLREAITEHPQSAKAHYVLAEVLAHEGNIGEAKAEASKAATLDPATHFTDPAKFQQFQHKLDAALAPASASRLSDARTVSEGERSHGGHGMSILPAILVIGGVVVLIALLWSRRQRPANGPYDTYNQAPPMNNGMPPSGGYPGSGYPGYPGYAPPAPASSGVGTAVAAGLGGLAAGALLDEALHSHRDNDTLRNLGPGDTYVNRDPSAQAYDDLRSDPVDMGNNDNSWDDSSSGGSDDSLDDNQW